MNIADFLYIATSICPDREAVVFEGQRYSFTDLGGRVNRVANALAKLGVGREDRIAILDVNCNQYVESCYGAARLGAIFQHLNFRASEEELRYMLADSEASILLVGQRYVDLVRRIGLHLPYIRQYVCLDGRQRDMLCYEDDLIGDSSSEEVAAVGGDEDICVLMYTAGTTGRPKGVPLSHSSFINYLLEEVEPPNPELEEKNLLALPLYHIAGFQAMLAATYAARTLIMSRQFRAREWLELIVSENVSRSLLVPTMLKQVIDDPDFHKYDLSSLRVLTYGAASMPLEVIKKAIGLLPWVSFINAFGQTETAATITALGIEDHKLEGTEEQRQKKLMRLATSIGRPLPDVKVKVVNEEGKELPPGEMGEIVAKGSRIMSGYWKNPEQTAQTMTEDGWIRTGDKGYRDDEGYFYLSGRADDLIIRGGENISPEEVENVLCSHPKVEEAALIGVPDPEWGQQPRAIVVTREGETIAADEIIEYCRTRLATFKRPRSVVFVDSLPRNPMGKVLRRVLRDTYGQP